MARRRAGGGKSRGNSNSGSPSRDAALSAGSLLEFIRTATVEGGVVTWAALRHQFSDLRRLRNVVRSLVRSGELEQDRAGNYFLAGEAGSGDLLVGTVAQASREESGRLVVVAADTGERLTLPPIERGRRDTVLIRLGDRVHYLSVPLNDGAIAQIIEVLEHSAAPVIGVLQHSRHGPYIDSLSPDYRGKVQLDDLPGGMAEGDTVQVRVRSSDRFGLRGDVTGLVSRGDVADAAATTLLASHGVPEEWSPDALAIADALPDEVRPGRFKTRVDLQDLPLVTIDGADARDFDDAVFAEPGRGGGWRLLVAIADVAHYVKSGSALDVAAFERGNSVYLPDRVIPMLPESLSNGLCSLRPNEPRLALVCDMQVAKNGRITDYKFYDGVICSWARLTYSQVNDYFTDATPLPTAPEEAAGVKANVDELHKVYGALLRQRSQRGALEFETRSGVLRLEEGRVAGIDTVVRNDAHRLIEEAMISANVCAAKLIGARDARGLYRVHEPPQKEKADVLRDALAYVGIRVKDVPSDPKALAELLEPLAGRDDAWLLYSLILRAMSQACYQPDNRGHFGLALTDYMHFTSPIRRYPDLIVHRVIKALVNGKRVPTQSYDKLLQAGEHLSVTERRAEDVERGVSNWLKCDYVSSRIGETFAGIVVGVQDFGLFVELDGYFVQGLVHIGNLGDDYFNHVPQSMSLVGERSGRSYQLGDELEVVLTDVQPAQGKLDLIPAANYKSYRRSKGKSGKGKNARR